ncbi:MAG TPA: hypothetical protein H9775_13440 [Candidatus Blautia merdipullorum]|nr:hypothetical protein [Candidatus Blautia merdipullorum]
MLKKLYKYDWKSVSMLLLVLHGVLLAYSIIGRLAIAIAENFSSGAGTDIDTPASLSTTIFGMGAVAYILIYAIFIVGIVLATILYLAVRMQKSLFSDEGYLTNTLPVSSNKLLWSKILVFWTWSAINFLCVALSILILVSYPDTMQDIVNGFQTFFTSLLGFEGFGAMTDTIMLVLGVIIEYFFYFTALILFSICLGSLFKTHKTLGAVVSFFGINIGQSIVMLIILFIVPPLSPISTMVTTESGEVISSTGGNGTAQMIFMLAWYLVLSVVFYFGSRYILTKKLNLD